MRRLSLALAVAFLGCAFSGCGEEQPNAPAQQSDLNADFGKKTADMMKAANTGMDPKAAKTKAAPK